MRDLPATLKYDYERRVIAREAKSSVSVPVEPRFLLVDSVTSASDSPSPLVEGSTFRVDSIRSLILEMEMLRKEIQAMLVNFDSELRSEKQLQVSETLY